MALARVVFIDDEVVRRFRRTTLEIDQTTGHLVELVKIDARDALEHLQLVFDRTCGDPDVRTLRDSSDKLFVHRRAAHADEGGPRGSDHDVGPDTPCALRQALDGPFAQTDERKDHRYLDANGDDSENRSYGPMFEVLDDEAV